jgi:hypothetical protein
VTDADDGSVTLEVFMPRQTYSEMMKQKKAIDLEPVQIKKTDDELLAECVRINDKVQELYKHSPTDTPVLWAELHCPKLAADYWRKTDALNDLLASRLYTADQVAALELLMLDALRVIIKAALVGKAQPLTDEEAFAVFEKAAIILEGMVTKNEHLAHVRALQALA